MDDYKYVYYCWGQKQTFHCVQLSENQQGYIFEELGLYHLVVQPGVNNKGGGANRVKTAENPPGNLGL